jgi:hypothetical protein
MEKGQGTDNGERLAPNGESLAPSHPKVIRYGESGRGQAVGRGWLLVIPRRSGMEKGQRTDSGERLATSHPNEIRYGEGAGD